MAFHCNLQQRLFEFLLMTLIHVESKNAVLSGISSIAQHSRVYSISSEVALTRSGYRCIVCLREGVLIVQRSCKCTGDKLYEMEVPLAVTRPFGVGQSRL